jgi:hypothetical protein
MNERRGGSTAGLAFAMATLRTGCLDARVLLDRLCAGAATSAFIDQQWRAHVVDGARGGLDRRAYELCAAYELRSALRAGRVWVPGSRRHADPTSYLLPNEQWQAP